MSRQSDNKNTKQVRIDAELHKLLKIEAAETRSTIKRLIESIILESYDPTTNKWKK
ncbi:MAG: hypothetical protein UR87_C0024G0004 [candidate division CPR3 bacterium GW2011_GWE2_35_7]|uniref:Uncharacterized protein n=1 Tax=candidate division CPR3 bacterium GW2011_GWF2_35_18 TaxID=1618350 RepID=A0A0G0BKP3_UNCC3|nr:MAG: hypothetical protein UR67_C0002G0138 [candidate division CPR3 bacterium GW2011_GWF2_35_18]KKP86260.1 MAG: hypothetical protein UR87_C0024G0004 [candidate division CPR3 bacterium GW2011_GWE2_35_7]